MTITDVLAIYGAVLSTFLAIFEIVKNNRKIRVTCRIGVVGISDYRSERVLSIAVVNIGHRPITITEVGLLMSDSHQFTQLATVVGRNPLPKLLNDGESETLYLDYSIALQAIKGLDISYKEAYVCDAEGKRYKAKLPKNFYNNSQSQAK